MNDVHGIPTATSEGTWQEIAGLIDDLAELSKSDVPPARFHAELLDRVVRASAAAGGVLWLCDETGCPKLVQQVDPDHLLGSGDGPATDQLRDLVTHVTTTGEPACISPNHAPGNGNGNQPFQHVLLLHPIRLADRSLGAVQILQGADRSPALLRANQQLLKVVCELASDFHRELQLRQFRDSERERQQREELVLRLLKSVNLDEAAYAIANDGQRLLGCDRVTVLTCRGGKCKARSVSGIDTMERRSSVIVAMEQLASRVVRQGQTTCYDSRVEDADEAVKAYLQESNSTRLFLVPLLLEAGSNASRRGEPVGALVIEDFAELASRAPTAAVQKRANWLADVSATALHHALLLSEMPLTRTWRSIAGWRARHGKWWLLALCASLVSATVLLVPAEFNVLARGELQPEEQQIVYAPADAVVVGFPALTAPESDQPGARTPDGRHVRRGDVVLELQSSDLDVALAELLGARETKQQQLEAAALAPERLQRATTPTERAALDELAARKLELSLELESLSKQLAILERERERLSIKATMNGSVQTWDVVEELRSRPVRQGQRLMTIANADGPWQLRLRVDDRHIGYVTAARSEIRPDLPVSFIYKAAPATTLRGRLQQVAMSTESVEHQGPTVLATVRIDDPLPDPRPGASVVARIHCGRKPLAYVWLCDLIETIRTRLLF